MAQMSHTLRYALAALSLRVIPKNTMKEEQEKTGAGKEQEQKRAQPQSNAIGAGDPEQEPHGDRTDSEEMQQINENKSTDNGFNTP